jgi:hypothetical protein
VAWLMRCTFGAADFEPADAADKGMPASLSLERQQQRKPRRQQAMGDY